MHLKFRNVNDTFYGIMQMFHTGTLPVACKPSRNGNVLMVEEPVLLTYTQSRERVLFNQTRDANPFFHLFEALWMLAGRNDVAPLAYYCSKMAQYSDDGKTFNGAYGYRWRKFPTLRSKMMMEPCELGTELARGQYSEVDQLKIIIDHLKADPNSRRAVLQMWNVEDDLLKIGGPLPVCTCGADRTGPSAEAHSTSCSAARAARTDGVKDLGSKDVCCNLSVMFALRGSLLDMTVTNRSNDLVLGLLGANYVHFSVLQEYMAALLGVGVGLYHHFTNNLHAYEWNWKPEEWLAEGGINTQRTIRGEVYPITVPLVQDPTVFEAELYHFVESAVGPSERLESHGREWHEPFLAEVALPMFLAFGAWKECRNADTALAYLRNVASDDWRIAGTKWIERRVARLKNKEVVKDD